MSRLLSLAALLTAVAVAAQPGSPREGEGLRVHCRGDGPPVYLVGGGPAFTTWHLAPLQESLAGAAYRACRWDMRGVGENRGAALPADGEVVGAWLADMDRVLPRAPVVLWGHSWGALQALLFSHRQPARVAGLVLSNPVDPALESLEGIEARRHVHPLPADAWPGREGMGTGRERLLALRRKIASYFPDPAVGWAYARRFDRSDADGALNVRVWEAYRAAPLDRAAVEGLAGKVAGLIYCREDVLMPVNLRAYRRLLPDGPHVVLEGCGHFPWADAPQAYERSLLDLVSRAAGG
jgi:pimeloyl-ACP methyl ester carboxylesterase